MSDSSAISPDEASRIIKEHASKQQIKVEITEDQLQAMLRQWVDKSPGAPAQITFVVKDRTVADLHLASCSYWGDTCCA
jgi:hypothetical protein